MVGEFGLFLLKLVLLLLELVEFGVEVAGVAVRGGFELCLAVEDLNGFNLGVGNVSLISL